MRSLTICRRTNIERHASVRGRTFWRGGVARSASRRLSCGFARVKRPNISFNRTRRRRALKWLSGVGGGVGPVNSVR
jgi:hypothetical protein